MRTLLSAGLDTTVFTLCNAILSFSRHPDQWALVHANPAIARQALEEVLRYESTFHSFYRTTTRAVEVAGVPMGNEQKICVFIGSANRDPRRWGETADRFDVSRRAAGNLAFGTGIHGCAGQMIARLEGEIVLTALARRVRQIHLEGPPVIHYNNSVRGYTSMPVSVTAAGRWHHASSRIAGCGAMSEWTRPSATKLPSFGVSPNWPPYAKRFVPSASTWEMPWSFHSHTKPPCRPGVFSKACQ